MKTFHITARHVSTAGHYELGEEKWLAIKGRNGLRIIHENSHVAEKQITKWSRSLGYAIHQYEDSLEQASYMEFLRKRIVRAGRAALAQIDYEAGRNERPRRTRRSKHQHNLRGFVSAEK